MSTQDAAPESRSFEADVSKLLHLMVHSVYSERDVFLRELISNAADACERLRFEAIANPALLDDDPKARITIVLDGENRRLTVEDNGIGMSQEEMIEALGTIARSGTKAFMDQIDAAQGAEGAQLSASSASASTRPSWSRIRWRSSRGEPAATRPPSGRQTARAPTRSRHLRPWTGLRVAHGSSCT
jgi:hypothetical protein